MFWDKFCGTTILVEPNFDGPKTCLYANLFGPKLIWTLICLDPYFWDQLFLVPKSFFVPLLIECGYAQPSLF